MYCNNCGNQIDDNAYVCPYCGVKTGHGARTNEKNILAIVGFVLSFLIAIAGLVCSILAYKKSKELNGEGETLAIAGIIISAISIVLSILLLVVYGAFLAELFSYIETDLYGYGY